MCSSDLEGPESERPAFGQLSGEPAAKGSAPQGEEYIDAVNNRYTAELDYAYMVGFQTAFRMMLLGITDPELIMSKIQPTADS